MDEIDISILKNVAKNPNQPIRKAFEGIAASERNLYRKAANLEQQKLLKFDTSEPGKILVRITGLGKTEINGRVEQTSGGGMTP